MNKKKWAIWTFDFPAPHGKHPVVLISHPSTCERATAINVLACTSQRQSRPPKDYEVILNGADGLDWETFVSCEKMFLVEAAKLHTPRGVVTSSRRREIRAKLIAFFGLLESD